MSEHFDVLVVGAGPAGIAAAVRAAERDARVALLDENPACGGQIWRKGAHQPPTAMKWMARLEAAPVKRLQGWRVFANPGPGSLLAEHEASGSTECAEFSYDKLILAAGARERFLPFPGWTLPNVMGAGGLDAMARGGLPVSGKRIIVAGTGPLLLAVAAHLADRGAKILAICEQAPMRRLAAFAVNLLSEPAKLAQGIALRRATLGARFYSGCWPIAAKGNGTLESVTLQQGGKKWDVPCDYLACGFHLVPNLELPTLLGCSVPNGFVAVDDLQQTSVPNVFCAGEPTGIGGVELAILEGQIAGLVATNRQGEAQVMIGARRKGQRFTQALDTAFALDPRLRELPSNETLVCRCEDVSFGTLREHSCARDAKLQTRCGMGPCQGRVCGAATEFLFGWTTDSVRPPVLAASISSLVEAVAITTEHISTGNRKDTA